MQTVSLFDITHLLQVFEPKTIASMLVVTTARLVHCVFIKFEIYDGLVESLLHWMSLNQIVKELNVELFGSKF